MLIAHAFGARYDLPVPLWMFVVGAGLVVLVSFAFVAPRPVAPRWAAPAVAAARRPPARPGAAGVAVALALAGCGVYGSQEVAENILPTAFWLLAWIAVPITCGIVGDWTQAWNPFAALARAADRDGLRARLTGAPERLAWPEGVGWWPATVVLFVVASGELIYNGTATRPLVTALAIVVYGLISAVGGLLYGDAWIERGEMWSVLFATWGRLGWWRFGRPGRRGWFGGLDVAFEEGASRTTFVFALLMSVTFDGLTATSEWRDFRRLLPAGWGPGSAGYVFVAVAAFAALIGLAWLVFGRSPEMLPSLLPIAFGYLVAHNFDYLAINGQLLVPLAGNPTGRAQWLPAPFDDSYVVDKNLVPSWFVWYLAVVVIVAVHVAAVVIAHRHFANRRRAGRAEAGWLLAMVAYTMTSLWLLAQPVVQEHPAKAAHAASRRDRTTASITAKTARVEPITTAAFRPGPSSGRPGGSTRAKSPGWDGVDSNIPLSG